MGRQLQAEHRLSFLQFPACRATPMKTDSKNTENSLFFII